VVGAGHSEEILHRVNLFTVTIGARPLGVNTMRRQHFASQRALVHPRWMRAERAEIGI